MWKLCLSTKFPHQKIRWNYGILPSIPRGVFRTLSNICRRALLWKQFSAFSSMIDVWQGSKCPYGTYLNSVSAKKVYVDFFWRIRVILNEKDWGISGNSRSGYFSRVTYYNWKLLHCRNIFCELKDVWSIYG